MAVDAPRNSQAADAVTRLGFAKQARRASIAFGRLGNAALEQMNRTIVGLAKAQINTAKSSLCTGGAVFAGMASGVHAGIARCMTSRPF
jgi:hypothetical protein